MTEKRFGKKVDDVDDTIIDITENGNDFAWFLSDDYTDEQVDKVVQRLNALHNENEQLKQSNSLLADMADKYQKLWHEVDEENEQLKKEIQFYYDTTNDDGKQIISDLVDMLEMKGMNVDWMKKKW